MFDYIEANRDRGSDYCRDCSACLMKGLSLRGSSMKDGDVPAPIPVNPVKILSPCGNPGCWYAFPNIPVPN